MRFRAYSVHLFTAAGASLAMLALLEAAQQDWAMMTIWLTVAFIVDGIDGPLARRYDVTTNAPVIDGVLLDLIIDFQTYVMIPAYALYGSGLMPGWSGSAPRRSLKKINAPSIGNYLPEKLPWGLIRNSIRLSRITTGWLLR